MNIEELKTFLTLADTKNFRMTSERLFCSTSTITSRIQTLEQELGVKLLERNNKSVKLTNSGQVFHTYASEMLNIWDMCRTNVNASQSFRRHLTIGAPASVWDDNNLSIISNLLKNSQSTASLLACHSIQILDGIANNTIDFGLTLQKPRHPNLECVEIKSDLSLFLVASPSVGLPADFLLSPQNIKEVPFCFMHQSAAVDLWFQEHYKYAAYVLETENMSVFIKLLFAGVGIGFLPERCAIPYIQTGQLLSYPYMFKDSLPKETIYAVYHRNHVSKIADLLQAFKVGL